MNDVSRSASDSFPGSHSGSVLRGAMRPLLYLSLAGALAVIAYATFRLTQEQAHVREMENQLVASRGLIAPVRKRLAAEYSDKQGRLLADPPSEEAKLLDPDTLVLARNIDSESDASPVDWDGLQAHLVKITGKQVVVEEYSNSADEVAAVKDGKIHIVALHSVDTPYLVNYAGFIPIGVLGTEQGANGNRLDIAVEANSKIRNLAELRGHELTCTRPDSITGYRAAITVLLQEAGMRPFVDYSISWSYGQSESILGIAAGQVRVAALSDDKVQSMLKKERIKKSDFRVIYQSQVIPHLTIGHVYNLNPQLATKVRSATFDFENQQGAADESSGQPMRFYPIDYKQDFEFVRKVDDSFDPRFGHRPKVKPTPEPTQLP